MKARSGTRGNGRTSSAVSVPPQLGSLVTEITEIPDIEIALRKVLSEYLELKGEALEKRIAVFEGKWGMSFDEFSQKCAEGPLKKDVYSYEVEKDFWEWEQAVTLPVAPGSGDSRGDRTGHFALGRPCGQRAGLHRCGVVSRVLL